RELENRLVQSGSSWQSIWDRMKHYDVPGVSVAVALNNKLSFASSYGFCEAGKPDAVLGGTAVQAPSVSKVIAAIGYHRLAQDGKLGLDDGIGPKLGWTLPVRACGKKAWLDQVTIRRLMQHNGGVMGRGSSYPLTACSGFTGDGGGYGGYADTAGVGVPTL